MVDARQEKGRELAKAKRMMRLSDSRWVVPSQTTADAYVVDTEERSCTCPDHEQRLLKCKHMWAIELSQTVEVKADGSATITETVKVTRKTCVQDWPNYNAAQVNEKAIVQTLLRDPCATIATPGHPGRAPKPLPMADVLFGCVMKVYTTVSGRRASTDIRACEDRGLMARAPSYNAVFKYMEKEELTPILTALIEQSAAPLASVESQFAVDSTGFSTSVYRCWFDAKYGRDMREHTWPEFKAMQAAS